MSSILLVDERIITLFCWSIGYGPYLSGSVGPNRVTNFFRNAEAMCNGALSLQITSEDALITSGRPASGISPRRSMQSTNLLSRWFPAITTLKLNSLSSQSANSLKKGHIFSFLLLSGNKIMLFAGMVESVFCLGFRSKGKLWPNFVIPSSDKKGVSRSIACAWRFLEFDPVDW